MKMTHKQLRTGLRQIAEPPPPRDRDEFWQDFRVRAALVPQQQVSIRRSRSGISIGLWGALAGGGAVLVAAALAISSLVTQHNETSLAGVSRVEEIDVFADCSSVLVFEDTDNRGTLVWLAGLDHGGLSYEGNGNEIL